MKFFIHSLTHKEFTMFSLLRFSLVVFAALSISVGAQAEVYFVHTDQLGTPQVMTDQAKQVVWQAQRSPFGENQSGTTPGINIGFPGQYFDGETGLSYNYYRDYDAATGRYVQSDPIGLEGGINTYAYVEGNPISLVDPLGLEGVGYWNNGSSVPVGRPLSPCEQEAFADFGINLIPLGALGSAIMDVAGIDVNPIAGDSPLSVGDYGADTPFAAAGHAVDRLAERYADSAERHQRRASERGASTSVRNGRINRAAGAMGRAGALRAAGGMLGPAGAMAELISALQECGCQN